MRAIYSPKRRQITINVLYVISQKSEDLKEMPGWQNIHTHNSCEALDLEEQVFQLP
jgi:hypothetical protein